jgi:hypothetical protein
VQEIASAVFRPTGRWCLRGVLRCAAASPAADWRLPLRRWRSVGSARHAPLRRFAPASSRVADTSVPAPPSGGPVARTCASAQRRDTGCVWPGRLGGHCGHTAHLSPGRLRSPRCRDGLGSVQRQEGNGAGDGVRLRGRRNALEGQTPRADAARNKAARHGAEEGVERLRKPEGASDRVRQARPPKPLLRAGKRCRGAGPHGRSRFSPSAPARVRRRAGRLELGAL